MAARTLPAILAACWCSAVCSLAAGHGPRRSLHAPWGGDAPPARPIAQRRPSFLSAQVVVRRPRRSRVAYFVYSDSFFLDTRLSYIRNTWAQGVRPGGLNVIGDSAYRGNASGMNFVATPCPKNSHGVGLCCKFAEAVRQAHRQMQQDPSIEWAYFIDDDVYVRPEALERALAHQEDPEDKGVVIGIYGCADRGCSGLCGGGGYAASRRAIEKAIGGGEEQFQKAEMDSCNKCGMWSDIAITEIYRDKHIDLRSIGGLYPWKVKKGQFDQMLDMQEEPITFHYVETQEQMEFLHSLFAGAGKSHDGDVDPRRCASYRGRVVCAQSESSFDAPWYQDDATEDEMMM
mmetsp:Transcript_3208/g.9230  ORF Transcript_3208/g.9230 Transcript_3208/m.9230 type:complete len:345 (+) Transcript_3208:90-1124(+)